MSARWSRAERGSSVHEADKPCRRDVVRFAVTQVIIPVRAPQGRGARRRRRCHRPRNSGSTSAGYELLEKIGEDGHGTLYKGS